jgi:hypothetical protein
MTVLEDLQTLQEYIASLHALAIGPHVLVNATTALTRGDHNGRIVLVDSTAGDCDITLWAAPQEGDFVSVHKIVAANDVNVKVGAATKAALPDGVKWAYCAAKYMQGAWTPIKWATAADANITF